MPVYALSTAGSAEAQNTLGLALSRAGGKRGLWREGVFHHPESCVRLHCRKQQVAVKGRVTPLTSPSPYCAAFQCERKVSLQPRLPAFAFLLRLSQGKLIRFTALSLAVS